MHEAPHRAVINLETALGQFRHKPAQGEVLLLDPLQQPGAVRAGNRLRPVPADLARRNAAGRTHALYPFDRRAHPHAELRRRSAARQATALNRRNHPLAKIDRVSSAFAHPCRPPSPASMLNQNPPDLGIPNRFALNSSRSRRFCRYSHSYSHILHEFIPQTGKEASRRFARASDSNWRVRDCEHSGTCHTFASRYLARATQERAFR
jgi:hypothetical protein